jgi:hypothetical protein
MARVAKGNIAATAAHDNIATCFSLTSLACSIPSRTTLR